MGRIQKGHEWGHSVGFYGCVFLYGSIIILGIQGPNNIGIPPPNHDKGQFWIPETIKVMCPNSNFTKGYDTYNLSIIIIIYICSSWFLNHFMFFMIHYDQRLGFSLVQSETRGVYPDLPLRTGPWPPANGRRMVIFLIFLGENMMKSYGNPWNLVNVIEKNMNFHLLLEIIWTWRSPHPNFQSQSMHFC
jgi:hypothetical protein